MFIANRDYWASTTTRDRKPQWNLRNSLVITKTPQNRIVHIHPLKFTAPERPKV
ncbi:hypothetical protein M378DRAFT_164478 [Amanita muscaria Koide BX008]|uniref:Uncharacterized protein n=1 Tax=Amanita muscaria (strain Koide BX008) TaxID=946122 RepID=A0A0C2WP43_AMAMK|nr:hypothetical protein M378DRAFT_164478 [Amanita muscaria Koide BX008]